MIRFTLERALLALRLIGRTPCRVWRLMTWHEARAKKLRREHERQAAEE